MHINHLRAEGAHLAISLFSCQTVRFQDWAVRIITTAAGYYTHQGSTAPNDQAPSPKDADPGATMNEPNTPVERLFDRRYGLIYRPDEFLRRYLREESTIDPDLHYRVVDIVGDEKVVSGYELIIFAQLYVRESMLTKVQRTLSTILTTIRAACGELFYGLVLYGRYYLPIATTEKH